MKHKKYKLRFIRNIAICVFALLIVARLLDIMPGFKRDKTEGITNLVIGDEDITEKLVNNIWIDENKVVYISYEDIKNLFDNSIIYDENYKQIITTSRTKVATLKLDDNYMVINDTTKNILGKLIRKEGLLYLPISDMELVYNIEVDYIPETDIVTIDEIDKKLTRATIAKNTSVKSKMRAFSQTLEELKTGEQISYYQDSTNGWIKIRTKTGNVGYIKKSIITNEYVVRQEIDREVEAKMISDNEVSEWLKIKEENFKEDMLNNYESRVQSINAIVSFILSENPKGIIIYSNSKSESFIRFMTEITPRLREIGVSVALKSDDINKTKSLKNIVDYIVK
ncbi:MAG: hypothetical protein IJN50_04990 [Clostridia bacterium]|nr:hypothetical protein [Clostridia bacterium]